MRHLPTTRPALAAVLCLTAGLAQAAPDARQTCKKMIAEGRGGGLSQAQCQCSYRVAEVVLDEDIRALLFDVWYTGANNMSKLAALKPRLRVEKQLRTMKATIARNCLSGLSP